MSAYLVAQIEINTPARFRTFRTAVGVTIHVYSETFRDPDALPFDALPGLPLIKSSQRND